MSRKKKLVVFSILKTQIIGNFDAMCSSHNFRASDDDEEELTCHEGFPERSTEPSRPWHDSSILLSTRKE